MTVTGIIAEFNPFHTGHRYLLEQAKGLKIVAMSGNFVQRGEPAIIDKWTRTQMALENGADLVVELPFLVAVQSADYFAQGAVTMLSQLGIDTLAFGTEELLDYQRLATVYNQKKEEMAVFLDQLPQSLSYPQKTQQMWESFAGVRFTGQTPNHILGLAYTKACAGLGIRLFPVTRQGAGFHAEQPLEGYTSATSLRLCRKETAFINRFIPSASLFITSPQVTWADYWGLLRYRLVTTADLTIFCQVNSELASRIYSAVKQAHSVEDLVNLVATKRYTKARIRRILTYILVGVSETPLPQGIHVLGFNSRGQEHLKTLKKTVPFVTRIGSKPWDPITQQADQVYRLGHASLPEQTLGRRPIRIENNKEDLRLD